MEKREEIKVVTKYTKEEYIKFQKFHQRRRNKLKTAFTYCCLALIILSGIGLILLKNYLMGFVYILIGVALFVLYISLPKILVYKILKSDKHIKDCVNEYIFSHKDVDVQNQYGNSKLPYIKFFKVYETDTNFYLYLNNFQAFILSKKEIPSNDIYKLSKLLKSKLKKDYIEK